MTMINRTDVDEVINELSSRQTGRRVLSKSQSQEDDAIAGGKAACLITAQHFHSYYWFKDDLLDGNRISWIYENIHNHNENGDSKRKVDTPHMEIKHIRTLKGRYFVLGLRRMKSERKPHHTTPFMCPLRRRRPTSVQMWVRETFLQWFTPNTSWFSQIRKSRETVDLEGPFPLLSSWFTFSMDMPGISPQLKRNPRAAPCKLHDFN